MCGTLRQWFTFHHVVDLKRSVCFFFLINSENNVLFLKRTVILSGVALRRTCGTLSLKVYLDMAAHGTNI